MTKKKCKQGTHGSSPELRVVDLFCGIGGLSHGLIKAGLNVVAGFDLDDSCRFGYEHNNRALFVQSDIANVTSDDLLQHFGSGGNVVRVLVGCAPCQPFSRLNPGEVTEKQVEPLARFASLIEGALPDVVSMENVPGLADTKRHPVFMAFLETLSRNGYHYSFEIVDVSDYGIPQRRKRLVLLASRFGEIELIKKTHSTKKITVRDTISHLEPLAHGTASRRDPLHRACALSSKNLRRIRATPHNGGNSSSWADDLLLECYKRDSGKTYKGTVYGRMRWDEPAPTMTTQCVGLGNGRFGHPEQDRAISLREAALLQTFPRSYRFTQPGSPIRTKHVAKFIGNAVPVKLGSVIGKSIVTHVKRYVGH